jgi:ubiquinol-cytochrome c reductase cytochrome c1 subunit
MRRTVISAALAALFAAALATCLTTGARAEDEAPPLPSETWSFSGAFGGLDLAAAQRGFQVYNEVCSACHSMNLLHYRDLAGIGLTAEQIKAVAASKDVPGPLNDQGEPTTVPGTPASVFKAPFPNEKAAAAANGGAIPPDQSVLENAREGGADYIYAILTGYADPPAGFKLQEGLYYNTYFPGHQIRMPQPLHDDQVTYADGTKATVAQEAHDLATFLHWTANPEEIQRKQIGWRMVLFFGMMAGLTYAVKRQIWSDVH